MATYFAAGFPSFELDSEQLRNALETTLDLLGDRKKILALPPDHTRIHSRAGELTCMLHEIVGERLTDVMPALGTHKKMSPEKLTEMFPGLPQDLVREHKWRDDVVTVGEVDADFVSKVTEGIWKQPWQAQLNRMIRDGGHDLILSIGQVVPHEVIGMANYNKNIFIGTGGQAGINESHFIGAAYGMERMMGRMNTPLRLILNHAQENFCKDMPIVYVLTVMGNRPDGSLATRGLFIGDDHECFKLACDLSAQVNVTMLDKPLKKVVVYLDPVEFESTWLGNKSIYRTRMAIADEGELIVLGPEVSEFGEDPAIDSLIRKYGYRTTPEIMKFVEENDDLRGNLSAAAHLIHGSSEGRFTITYCPGKLTAEEIHSVGYHYGDLTEMTAKYDPAKLDDGMNTMPDGEEIFFVRNPALGLWAERSRWEAS